MCSFGWPGWTGTSTATQRISNPDDLAEPGFNTAVETSVVSARYESGPIQQEPIRRGWVGALEFDDHAGTQHERVLKRIVGHCLGKRIGQVFQVARV